MKLFKKLFNLLGIEKSNVIQIYFLSFLQGIFYVLLPITLQAVITYTMTGRMSASLYLLCFIAVGAVIVIGLFQLWQMRINETIQQFLFVNVGKKFSEKLYALNPQVYIKENLPLKINQFFEVVTLQKGLSKLLLDVSTSVISIIFGLLILPSYNAIFLIFSIVIVIVIYITTKYYGTKALEYNYYKSKKKYLFVDYLQNLSLKLKSNQPVTADEIENGTNKALNDYIEYRTKFYTVIDLQYKSILVFKIIFTSILLIVGVLLVQNGLLNIGQFVASEIIILLIINAVEKLILSLETVYDVLTGVEKIHEVLEFDEIKKEVEINESRFNVFKNIFQHNYSKKTRRLLYGIFSVAGLLLFMPWTQTINSEGRVTTLNPTDRPQTVPSRIAGRVEKWYVKEGDKVQKNDTIAFISEIKDDYFDPQLVQRTQNQVKSKEGAITSYESKINAIDIQIDAINASLILKLEQTKNKIEQNKAKIVSDSAEYVAAINNNKITDDQFKRFEELLAKGIISKTEYENRKIKLQENTAKKVSAENKLANAKNDLLNAQIEFNSVKQEYNEKLMKAESDKFSSLSLLFDAEVGLTKMQSQLTNYSMRNNFYYVLAPQTGFITQTFIQGVGEIVKEAQPLLSIVPENLNQSIEMFIEPINLPLVQKNLELQIIFDGWPAFTFTGWPGISFGTYAAKVVAIDKVISANGKFRVLAIPHNDKWPAVIQVGGGVKGFVLLKNVPLIYEIWRQINGFPPEFYKSVTTETKQKEKEKVKNKK